MDTNYSRRQFLSRSVQLSSALMITGSAKAYENSDSTKDMFGKVLPRRKLGKTSLNPTIYTVGGWHVGRHSELKAQAIIENAIKQGVRFFDTANMYQNGASERYYGKFLTPKYGKHIEIMTKSTAKNSDQLQKDLDQSFESLKVDVIDLFMIHSILSPNDVDTRLKNGVLDLLIDYKKRGKIKHIGFTGHRDFNAHKHLLDKNIPEIEACLMPINLADPSYKSFINNTMKTMHDRQMGIMAMKSLCNGGFFGNGKSGRKYQDVPSVIPNKVSIAQAHHFALSLPISTLVSGVDEPEQIHDNLKNIWAFKALDKKEQAVLIQLCQPEALTGKMENFKA
ncbi:aldo/keto reductase [Lentisphaera marina]|uniref:aldo/keto reductase n=1 Tax=Lentisphaera marina TaxID=1111041 RepID=UPI002365B42D|nr:aldo/keto reductase [Lentisphaera marina]MDD7984902.1 aldo/keto reductase [Lentisphaera marina]